MKNKTKTIISLILNILIVLFTIIACIIMFTSFKFMNGYDVALESSKFGMFRFFTVQSNIFVGIASLIFLIYEIKILRGKKKNIPTSIYNLKLIATSAVTLTFIVVFTYLGRVAKGGLLSLLMNSNLFFHLIIPILSVIAFVIFERTNKIKFKYTFLGVVPTFLYEMYYLTNILIHAENNQVPVEYDWYYFVQNGITSALIIAPLMLVITYIITLILWALNKKSETKETALSCFF